jgi:DNA gyrase subunit B
MPEIIERGHLFIAQPPLYKSEKGRSSRYLKDDAEMDAYLIDEGTSGETLVLRSGEQIGGEDLRQRVRDAAVFKQTLARLALRAPESVLEQAALAGAMSPGAGDAEANKTAERLNTLAEEGENTWSAKFENGGLVLEREVRNVTERAALDSQLLALPDAKRLAERAEAMANVYADASVLRHEKGGEVEVFGPLSLLSAVLESGAKGIKIQRYKGLGEMNPDQLWETTLDKNARSLLQVRVQHADTADEMFTKLMGDLVEPRREFIQDNALEAEVDV